MPDLTGGAEVNTEVSVISQTCLVIKELFSAIYR